MVRLLENARYEVDPDEDFDLEMIDEGIRERVVLLRNAGYQTFTSCQGGEGHCFKEPTIGIMLPKLKEFMSWRSELMEFLFANKLNPFTIELKLAASSPTGVWWENVYIRFPPKTKKVKNK